MSRSFEYEVEVHGTPDQVWQAIATGPGISAWFVPTTVEGREAGAVRQDHGGGLEAAGRITAYEAPHRFAFREPSWQPTETAEPAPVATEFLVEARAGGACVVRVVSSGFGTGAEWDDAIESMNQGWPIVLRHLKLYLEDFAGAPAASIMLGGPAPGPLDRAWASLTTELGLPASMAVGDRVATSGDAPALGGVVEVGEVGNTLLRVDHPAPGAAIIGCYAVSDPAVVMLRVFHYGEGAGEQVARDEPAWQAWMHERFPQPAPARS